MERKVINRKHFSFWSLKKWTFSVLSQGRAVLIFLLFAHSIIWVSMDKVLNFVVIDFETMMGA